MDSESQIKRLEDENFRLLEVAKLTREGVQELEKQNREFKMMADDSRSKIKTLEEKCAKYESEIAHLEKARNENQKSLVENEKKRIGKDLDAMALEEHRLLEKIRGLEDKCLQREAELKMSQAALAQQEGKHRATIKALEMTMAQQAEKNRATVKMIEDAMSQQEEKHRIAAKASAVAMAQQAEKHRAALRASEAAVAQQAEKHRAALKEYESKHRSVDDNRRNFEREKKELTSELSVRSREVAQLKATLQEASGTSEKLNKRIAEMKLEMHDLGKQCKTLQLEKEALQAEKQSALKQSQEKAVSLTALGDMKERLDAERQRLEAEKLSLRKELEIKAAEEVRLLAKVQELESRYLQQDDKVRASEQTIEQHEEKHRLALKEYEEKLRAAEDAKRDLEKEKARLEAERAVALKQNEEKAAALIALGEMKERFEIEKTQWKEEKLGFGKELENKSAGEARLLKKLQELEAKCSQKEAEIRSSEAMIAEQAEKYRLTIKEYETKQRMADEMKLNLDKEKKDLAAKLSGRTVEGAQLRAGLQESHKAIEKLTSRVAELKDELQNSAKQYKALQTEKARLESEKGAALKQNEEKAAALIALGEVRERLEFEKKRLEEEKRGLGRSLEAQAAEEARLLKLVQDLEAKCAQKEVDIRSNETVIAEQAEKYRVALKEHELKQRAAEEVRGRLEREKEQLEFEKQAVLKQNEEKSASLMELGEIKKSLEIEKRRLEEEIRGLSRTLEAQALEEARLKKLIEDLEVKSLEKDAEIRAGEATLTQQNEKYDLALKDYEAKLRAAEDVERNLQWEKKGLEGELAGRTVEGAQLRASLEESGKALEKLNAQIAELKEALQQAEKQHKVLQLEKKDLEEEKQAILKINEKKIAIIENLEKDKRLSKSEEQRLWAERKNIEGERKRLESEKKRLEDEKRSFSKELEARASEDAQLLARIQSLETDKITEEARLLKKLQDLEMKCAQKEAEIKTAEDALAQQIEKHRAMLQENEAKRRAADESQRNLEREKRELTGELSGRSAEVARMKGELEENGQTLAKLNGRIVELKEKLKIAGEEGKALRREKEQLELDKQAALKKNEEKTASLEALSAEKKRLESAKAQLEGVRLDLERDKRGLAEDLAEKSSEAVRLKAGLEENSKIIEQLNVRIVELRDALETTSKERKMLQREKDRLEEEKQLALKENEERAGAIRGLESEKRNLKEQEQQWLIQKEDLERERGRLENERARLQTALEGRSAQWEAVSKQCAELNTLIHETKRERDQGIIKVEGLERTLEQREKLLKEKETAQRSLEEALKQEKNLHAKVQAHARQLEESFVALENKVNTILQVPQK